MDYGPSGMVRGTGKIRLTSFHSYSEQRKRSQIIYHEKLEQSNSTQQILLILGPHTHTQLVESYHFRILDFRVQLCSIDVSVAPVHLNH